MVIYLDKRRKIEDDVDENAIRIEKVEFSFVKAITRLVTDHLVILNSDGNRKGDNVLSKTFQHYSKVYEIIVDVFQSRTVANIFEVLTYVLWQER